MRRSSSSSSRLLQLLLLLSALCALTALAAPSPAASKQLRQLRQKRAHKQYADNMYQRWEVWGRIIARQLLETTSTVFCDGQLELETNSDSSCYVYLGAVVMVLNHPLVLVQTPLALCGDRSFKSICSWFGVGCGDLTGIGVAFRPLIDTMAEQKKSSA